jgi:hypothetical protein
MEEARTLVVRPPSARGETWFVARAAFHIAYWSALVVSAETYAPSASQAATARAPFEVAFQDLDPADQRLYRAIREGVAEAERRREAKGSWPSAEDLAREGVPPFAPDPIDRARHAWTFAQRGPLVNYAGTPAAGSGKKTFLVIITEPDPGTKPDPNAVVDDVHHRLADGTMIHVNVWLGPSLSTREAVAVVAAEEGWRQITAGPGK